MVTWNGFVAPAGTPEAIVAKLNAALNEALSSPSIKSTLASFGAEPLGGPPRQFADLIAAEARKWSEIIRLAGVKID
jgi:tripartite-type tricarboxylate transporter receptor subunit TctC